MRKPAALGRGARISLVAPAGPLPEGGIDRAIARVRSLGWEPEVGRHARGRHGYLSGADEERLQDLTRAFESSENDAIWCLRGGYGTMRILDRLDWSPLRERPRPLIGFSDNTALHLAARREGVVTFHGPHPAPPNLSDFSLNALKAILEGGDGAEVFACPDPRASEPMAISGGASTGPLVGGNLSLIAATMGTPYQIDARGGIVFLEEVGEPAYRLDRLLTQLLMGGAFDGVAGIAVGAISETPDADRNDVPSVSAIVADRLGGLGVPVAIGFPFGHVRDTWTLPVGVPAALDATMGKVVLLEPAVST